jgi:hypothetical protein
MIDARDIQEAMAALRDGSRNKQQGASKNPHERADLSGYIGIHT